MPLDAAGLAGRRARCWRELGDAAARRAGGAGRAARRRCELRAALHLRYQGTDTALVRADGRRWTQRAPAFEAAYRQRFAFLMPDRPLVIEAVSVEAIGAGERAPEAAAAAAAPATCARAAAARAHVLRGRRSAAAGARPACSCARRCSRARVIDGPAIIAERNATTVVEPGWQARLTAARRAGAAAHARRGRGSMPSAPRPTR